VSDKVNIMHGTTDISGQDARRQRPMTLRWQGMIGRLYIDDVLWAAVEWSDKRQAWCIEDAEGRCLSHKDHIHGQDAAKEPAVALAMEMIRDGRMPTPEDAKKVRRTRLDKKKNTPSAKRRQAEREEEMRICRARYDAQRADEEAQPFHELLAEAFDLADPELWRSNTFA
jgi:hypothetical protein